MVRTIALKIAKLIFFIVIFLVVGKCMQDPYIYILENQRESKFALI